MPLNLESKSAFNIHSAMSSHLQAFFVNNLNMSIIDAKYDAIYGCQLRTKQAIKIEKDIYSFIHYIVFYLFIYSLIQQTVCWEVLQS